MKKGKQGRTKTKRRPTSRTGRSHTHTHGLPAAQPPLLPSPVFDNNKREERKLKKRTNTKKKVHKRKKRFPSIHSSLTSSDPYNDTTTKYLRFNPFYNCTQFLVQTTWELRVASFLAVAVKGFHPHFAPPTPSPPQTPFSVQRTPLLALSSSFVLREAQKVLAQPNSTSFETQNLKTYKTIFFLGQTAVIYFSFRAERCRHDHHLPTFYV